MIAKKLCLKGLTVQGNLPTNPKCQQRAIPITCEKPVVVMGAIGQFMPQKGRRHGRSGKIGHSLTLGGSRGLCGAPIIEPMPKTPHVVVLLFLTSLLVAGSLQTGCAKRERSPGEIREAANNAYARGDYARSLAEWDEYARVVDAPLVSDIGRGRALLALERPSEAVIPLERVYRADPTSAEKLELLIEALYGAGERERLIQLLQDRTRQPGAVSDFLRLGQYAQMLGDPDEAQRALLAAARVDRGQSFEPQFRLAEFYHTIGDTDRALERYAMALWFDYSNEQVADRIRALGETPGRTYVKVPHEAIQEGLLPADAPPPDPRPRG